LQSNELLRRGVEAARVGRRTEAREILLRIVDEEPRNEMAWVWLTGLVDGLEDKIVACENVLTINPGNEKVKAYLRMLLQQKATIEESAHVIDVQKLAMPAGGQVDTGSRLSRDPLWEAERLEHEGKFEEAKKAYEILAAKAKSSSQFDHIYRQIVRLEGLQQEKIRFVAPALSIRRMTFTWSLLYLSLLFVQVGLNPFAHFSFLWIGLPVVGLGSFLLALSEVRTRHVIWEKIFLEEGSGSHFARTVLMVAGWVFVILPFALMILNSLARLQHFQIPPEPFFR
jgi:hypothetical protein